MASSSRREYVPELDDRVVLTVPSRLDLRNARRKRRLKAGLAVAGTAAVMALASWIDREPDEDGQVEDRQAIAAALPDAYDGRLSETLRPYRRMPGPERLARPALPLAIDEHLNRF